ncbi:malto-oligosyltrehalose trehalohydrolase [Dyadobacter pollutisoli]|uniref:Malto-oligosyltrehalose trehalohydrolase n=1 Tax=Dyadobacter pollutisoli TaxID=2910158 RepID=A0A9E8SMH4_9BACT|nr:malto-oligosyltrehalose trehalohydrolase [Dyadobacter pollutisoli]WAC14133.1 malto-oligosyltrehalose trehalohydrolase [Dyadobacter pollutisoli]
MVIRKSGAYRLGREVKFTVWAPQIKQVKLHLEGDSAAIFEMQADDEGYFNLTLPCSEKPYRYWYEPDGQGPFPDPASQYQPDGVHGCSQVVDHNAFKWTDERWKGKPFEDLVMYELHVGAFTPEGTFDAIIPRLEELAETGINAIELMPVSEFPGSRNWGYDAVFPYSVHSAYGGPEKLKALVNEAHRLGIAVFLDIVINHIGPEGNYFGNFGPYFTDKYSTPWGKAINFDGEWSDGVREYFSELIVFWSAYYHLDGLRLDAIHEIFDKGAFSFWELVQQKLAKHRRSNGRAFHLIAESDLNSPRVTRPVEVGGMGFDAQWLDDFHHALYVLLDEPGQQRYVDFGTIGQLAKAYKEGFVHSGSYVNFRKRKHGASSAGVPGNAFVAFNLNHDQAGNRAGGERLSQLVSYARQKVAAAALMLSPYVPMLFMGEEYGEDTPFFFFVSHSDPELIESVIEGRRREFKDFGDTKKSLNPQNEQTFLKSKIKWQKRTEGKYAALLAWTKALITLRQTHPALRNFDKDGVMVDVISEKALALKRSSEDQKADLFCYLNFSDEGVPIKPPGAASGFKLILDSGENAIAESTNEVLAGPGVKIFSRIEPAFSGRKFYT